MAREQCNTRQERFVYVKKPTHRNITKEILTSSNVKYADKIIPLRIFVKAGEEFTGRNAISKEQPASHDLMPHLARLLSLGTCSVTAARSVGVQASSSSDTGRETTIVYPNPVADKLTIKVGKLQADASVKVYNVNGVAVITGRLITASQDIPVYTLAAGVYYVQVINGVTITTQIIVKQ